MALAAEAKVRIEIWRGGIQQISDISQDVVAELTMPFPLFQQGISGVKARIHNEDGAYTGNIQKFDVIKVFLWREGDVEKRLFEGKVVSLGYEGNMSQNEYFIILNCEDYGQEMHAPPELIQKIYENRNGKTIITEILTTLNKCTDTSQVDPDNDIVSTHDLEFDEITPYEAIMEVLKNAKTAAGDYGFDAYIDPDAKLHVFKRGKYTSGVTPIILDYRRSEDIHRLRNKIKVYGARERAYPANKDVWTDWTTPQNKSNLTSDAAAAQKIVNVADGTKFSVEMSVLIMDNNSKEENKIASINVNELTMENNLVFNCTVAENGFVQELSGWYCEDITTGTITGDSVEKLIGSYSVKLHETSGIMARLVFMLKEGEEADCYWKSMFTILNFHIKVDKTFFPSLKIELVDDAAQIISRVEGIAKIDEWSLISVPVGQINDDQWTVDSLNSQPFNWKKVRKIKLRCDGGTTAGADIRVDYLFFGKALYIGTAEDSASQGTYAVRCNKPITDPKLKSDAECDARAELELRNLKDALDIFKKITVVGDHNLVQGDVTNITISNDNLNKNYRMAQITHKVYYTVWETDLVLVV